MTKLEEKYSNYASNIVDNSIQSIGNTPLIDLSNFIKNNALSERSQIIASYALCGFANFGSIGIQLGGIGSMAPDRRSDLSNLIIKAMIGGALASWLTASIAGILI